MISGSSKKVDLFHTDLMIFTSDLKIVILGDASVGKTSLIQRYLEGVFTQDHTSVSVFFPFIASLLQCKCIVVYRLKVLSITKSTLEGGTGLPAK